MSLMKMTALTLFALVAMTLQSSSSVMAASEIALEKQSETLVFTVDGKPFTTFHFGNSLPKPYFSPLVAAPDANHPGVDTQVTRKIVADPSKLDKAAKKNYDHLHHKGAWVALDEINKIKFWVEKGRILNQSLTVDSASESAVQFTVVNHWFDTPQPAADAAPVIIETSTYTLTADRLIKLKLTFTAPETAAHFEDTKEGMWGVRMADDLRGKAGGVISNSLGDVSEKTCWGKEASWVDYQGKRDGVALGVTLFDHPDNPMTSRYHVRGYGLFAINPFGQHAYSNKTLPNRNMTLQPGESITFHYGMLIYSGAKTKTELDEVFKAYVACQK